MKSLADYEGGKWMKDGWHDTTVTGLEKIENPKTGNVGVSFELEDAGGAKQSITFWLTKDALWRLNNFAKDCGLSNDEMRAYDVDLAKSHRSLIGKSISVEVARQQRGDPKYGEVIDFQSTDVPKPAPRMQPPSAAPVATDPQRDDVPF